MNLLIYNSSYKCYNRTFAPGKCDGQTSFSVEKLDNLVEQIIRIQLSQIQKAPPQTLLAKQRTLTYLLVIMRD